MSAFIATEKGHIATSAIISTERSPEGKAILNLRGGHYVISADPYDEVLECLGPVIPNTTGCLAIEILIHDDEEPDENGDLGYTVWKLPILAWRIIESRAVPITATYGTVTHILYPDGSVDELNSTIHVSLDDAVRGALKVAKG